MASVRFEQRERRRRRRLDAEQEILDAAERLLRERPFRDLTIDDVMAATGQSRTAFYRHFTDRHDLLIRLMQGIGSELYEMSAGWLAGDGDPLVEGRQAIEQLAAVYAAHGPLLKAIAQAAHHDAEVERVYLSLVNGFIDATAARIERDIAAGRCHDLDPRQTAAALVWMTECRLGITFCEGPSVDASSVIDAIFTIWIRTLYGHDPEVETADV